MPKRKAKWKDGDVFLIKQLDSKHSIGQVVAYEPEALNSILILLFDIVIESEKEVESIILRPSTVFSAILVTRESLDTGKWKVVTNMPVNLDGIELKNEPLRSTGFIGAKIYGSRIVTDFVNAYHGLSAWDDWKDPDYLDGLLLSPDKKPNHLIFKNSIK